MAFKRLKKEKINDVDSGHLSGSPFTTHQGSTGFMSKVDKKLAAELCQAQVQLG